MWEQPPFASTPESSTTEAGVRPWRVVVEYANPQAQGKPPVLVATVGSAHDDLESAVAAAVECAYAYEPPDPWSPQGRTVYEVTDREFLVLVEGMTATFPFTVRVVRPLPARS